MKESLHTASTFAAVGTLAVAGWLLKGLFGEVRDRMFHLGNLVPIAWPEWRWRLGDHSLRSTGSRSCYIAVMS
jgi:hypothetical protein